MGNIYAGVMAGLTVASFTSSDPNASAGQFTATVNWGDGSPVDHGATVTGSNGTFTVLGNHNYAVDSVDQSGGAYQVTVTITGPYNSTLTATQPVRVERPPQLGAAENVLAQPDGTLTNAEVATFADPDLSDGTGEFSATISWGDGSTSTGTVTGSGGVFHVLGSHTYAAPGEFPVEVVVSQAWGFYAPAMLLPQVIAQAPGQTSEKPPLAKGTPNSGQKNVGDLWQRRIDNKGHEFDLLDNPNSTHFQVLVGVYRTADASSGVTFGYCRYPNGRNGQFFPTDKKGAFSEIVWYNWEAKAPGADDALDKSFKECFDMDDQAKGEDTFFKRLQREALAASLASDASNAKALHCTRYVFDPVKGTVTVSTLNLLDKAAGGNVAKWVTLTDADLTSVKKINYKKDSNGKWNWVSE